MLVAYYNRETRNVWVEDKSSRNAAVTIGTANDTNEAYMVIGRAKYVRTGNWLPAYGPVFQCTLQD